MFCCRLLIVYYCFWRVGRIAGLFLLDAVFFDLLGPFLALGLRLGDLWDGDEFFGDLWLLRSSDFSELCIEFFGFC